MVFELQLSRRYRTHPGLCLPTPAGASNDTPGTASSIMDTVPTPPESKKTSLRQRLKARASQRWPQLAELTIRHHGGFAYINGQLPDGTTVPLFRLRYSGSAHSWGFAIHLATRNSYENSVLPSGNPVGTPEEALDGACGLYLNDPTAWTTPPTN